MDSISQPAPATIAIRNIGGISTAELSFTPGVTVLEGRNATNRTSLLQAVAAALGSNQATLKTDADEGAVELTIDGDTYSRSFTRAGKTVSTGGEPYLDDPVVADLFAFLFGSNEARQAVLTGQGLRDIILRPIDTEALNAEIEDLREKRERIQAQLDELADLADRLPRLEQRRQSLREQLADEREQLSTLRAKLETDDADPERRKALREDLEAKVADLNEARSELDALESRIESESESLASLRSEREDLIETLDTVPDVASTELDQLRTELSSLRERKRSIESTLSRLDEIIEFNRTMLEADDPTPLGAPSDTDVTDALRPDSDRTIECWTCGTEVGRTAIEDTQERLTELRADLIADRDEIADRVASLKTDISERREHRDRRERIQSRLDRIDEEITDREAKIANLRERRTERTDRIEELETAVDRLRQEADEGDDAVLEQYREASEREYEITRLEDELDEVTAEIEDIQERLSKRDRLEERQDAIAEELVDRHTRIEEIERDAVAAFNDHMEALLAHLEYENVERVWIDRREVERRRGRRTVTDQEFDLHVVRSGDDGAVYEDSIETLSESEREVIGLVFALAGYLAHDVHETVPFMLLDSVETIDAERIATLVEYFATHVDYLLIALLPEDAAAVDADDRITEV